MSMMVKGALEVVSFRLTLTSLLSHHIQILKDVPYTEIMLTTVFVSVWLVTGTWVWPV